MSDLPTRRLILLSGPQQWGNETAQALLTATKLPDRQIWWEKTNKKTASILGQDKTMVIVDAYLGLNPDLLGRISGTIRAGGALLMICPALDAWPHYADPQKAKLTPFGLDYKSIGGQYLSRWVRLLKQFEGVECFTPSSHTSPKPVICALPSTTLNLACTNDQQRAIDAIIKTATGQRRRPAIIRADRGRGKSAAMGIAAGSLICYKKAQHIIVTAGKSKHTDTLFKHAKAIWPDGEFNVAIKTLLHDDACIEYKSVDALLSTPHKTDLVLVDEAATLGVARLEQLLLAYPRIAFATTEHGYEGSGRGFSLKFRKIIKQHSRGQRDIKLFQPIRWANDDPLEDWLQQLLLLGIHKNKQTPPTFSTCKDLSFNLLSQEVLAQDEALLSHVFHLLVDAHYQTRPSDVRFLLDAPNSQLWAASHKNNIIGLAWLMTEGQIDADLAQQISTGKRRPQGHLVPQILAAHLGLYEAARLSCTRIQRIVVTPELQNHKIGRWMLAELNNNLQGKTDYIASSFGCDLALTRFWQDAGYRAVRIGDKRRATSGLHSAVMIKAVSSSAKRMVNEAREIFAQQLITQLNTSLATLSSALVDEIILLCSPAPDLSSYDAKTAVLFSYGKRPLESSISTLHNLAIQIFMAPSKQALSKTQRQLFILRILQNQPWDVCAAATRLKGKNQCLESLRGIIKVLLLQISTLLEIAQIRQDYDL